MRPDYENLMGWKQNKMAAKGESTADSTPSTYSPLSRKWAAGYQPGSYSVADSGAGLTPRADPRSQYDALPVGTLGTYDPAADEIDYSFYQNARPNRRRLLYSRVPDPDPDEERAGELAVGGGGGGGRRKHRGKRDWALRTRTGSGSELADMAGEDSVMDDAELSTETLYVMLLVLASTAVTMLAAYLILL